MNDIVLSRDEYFSLIQYKAKVEVCLELYERGEKYTAVDALAALFEIEVDDE